MKKDMETNGEALNAELKFEPLWDFILMEPIREDRTKGGLVLPEGARIDQCPRSKVIKAGPGAYRTDGTFVPNPIKPGDVVYHLSMTKPFTVALNGKIYLVMSGRDAVALERRQES